MPKVFESTGIINEANQEEESSGRIYLYIDGDGMFTMRSPWPVVDNRAGVKFKYYYTRSGIFIVQLNGAIADQYGGILQAEAGKGKTKDLIVPNVKICEWEDEEQVERQSTLKDFKFSTNGVFCYLSAPKITGCMPCIKTSKLVVSTGQSIAQVSALAAPIQAQFLTGKVLENCWTGKVVINSNRSTLVAGKYETLNPVQTYDVSPMMDVIRPVMGTPHWALSMWSTRCAPSTSIPIACMASDAAPQVLSPIVKP